VFLRGNPRSRAILNLGFALWLFGPKIETIAQVILRSPLEISHPSFGEAARFFRVEAEMTQEQVAERSGLHVTHVSELEQGRGNPTRKTIDGLAEAFEIPPAYLFNLEDIYEWKRNRLKRK